MACRRRERIDVTVVLKDDDRKREEVCVCVRMTHKDKEAEKLKQERGQ